MIFHDRRVSCRTPNLIIKTISLFSKGHAKDQRDLPSAEPHVLEHKDLRLVYTRFRKEKSLRKSRHLGISDSYLDNGYRIPAGTLFRGKITCNLKNFVDNYVDFVGESVPRWLFVELGFAHAVDVRMWLRLSAPTSTSAAQVFRSFQEPLGNRPPLAVSQLRLTYSVVFRSTSKKPFVAAFRS